MDNAGFLDVWGRFQEIFCKKKFHGTKKALGERCNDEK
jgi:hypothetical protein